MPGDATAPTTRVILTPEGTTHTDGSPAPPPPLPPGCRARLKTDPPFDVEERALRECIHSGACELAARFAIDPRYLPRMLLDIAYQIARDHPTDADGWAVSLPT